MKKLLYPVIGFAILCLSFFSTSKKTEEKRIEEQGSDNLILKPFQMFGMLWSCSPDESDGNDDISQPESTHYSELVDSTHNSGTHSSHYSGTHYSHNSEGHGSHYSGVHLSHYSSTHSSHYSGTHSSHYSGTHQSHQSHSSHSSHYSAR